MPLLAFCAALSVAAALVLAARRRAALLAGTQGRQILFVLWFGAACALWWDRRIGLALGVLAVANGVGFAASNESSAHSRTTRRTRLRSSTRRGKLTMIVSPARALRVCAARNRSLASARHTAAGRDRVHAALELRAEPHRLALPRAAARGYRRRRRLRRRSQSPLRARNGAVRDRLDRCSLTMACCGWGAGPMSWIGRLRSRGRRAKRRSDGLTLSRAQEGAWAVAAANPRVRLDPHPYPRATACPAFNTDASAFFASLVGRAPPQTCGGVPLR